MPFEKDVRSHLDNYFPCCTLSTIPIFRPDGSRERTVGYEIDHLIHVQSEMGDRLIIIECKDNRVFGDGPNESLTAEGGWYVRYHDNPEPKNIKSKQLENHSRALISYLRGHERPLLIEAWCLSSYPTPRQTHLYSPTIHFKLFGPEDCARELVRIKKEERVLRVEQSALLGELRKGFPVTNMGHPELNHAITYVSRSRNAIDLEMFGLFDPRPSLWAINGTAGMGKSVLLAYALFCFASNRWVRPGIANAIGWDLDDFSSKAESIGLPPQGKRVIYAMAQKEKQLRVLEQLWEKFVREYSVLDDGLSMRFQRPIFRRWSGEIDEDCNILLIDEAHDLDESSQETVRAWHQSSSGYLAIACDRHQKLRLVGTDAPLIQGLSFSGKTTKLKRNYRNPFPVYATSLALMFGWMSKSGPKVIPTRNQLQNEFGFQVEEYSDEPGGRIVVSNWNDSHPANHWSFTISAFFSCEDAHAQLAGAGLATRDVLWVRFGAETDGFDYEKLQKFTYHNCHTPESFDLVDKYVKGQDYPVVVIEGWPTAGTTGNSENELSEEELKAWKSRRELYLCCSRATAFLYFVLPGYEATQADSIGSEILGLIDETARPSNPDDVTRRIWQLAFTRSQVTRRVDDFILETQENVPTERNVAKELIIDGPVSVASLAKSLGLTNAAIVPALFAENFTFRFSSDSVPEAVARQVALKNGIVLKFREAVVSPQPSQSSAPTTTATVEQTELLPAPNLPEEPAILIDLEKDMNQWLYAPEFPRFGSAVDQYLSILQWLVTRHPRGRDIVLGYSRGRRSYFADSEQEIYRRAASPNPRKIPGTDLFALTTTDTITKRQIIAELLDRCGFSLEAREKAVSVILS